MNQQNNEAQLRERKALELAAGGHVSRRVGEFIVSYESDSGETVNHSVKRNSDGKIACSCRAAEIPGERCVHIAAVGYAVKLKTTEARSLPAAVVDSSSGTTTPSDPARRSNVLPMKFRESVIESGMTAIHNDSAANRNRANEIRRKLDTLSPDWIYSVKSITQIGGFVVVTGAVTVDGVTREGVGSVRLSKTGSVEAAEEAAFCEASGRFLANLREIIAVRPTNPLASTLGDLISGKQLRTLRAMTRETGIDADAECRKILGCAVDELSRDAAAFMIGHLETVTAANTHNFALVG